MTQEHCCDQQLIEENKGRFLPPSIYKNTCGLDLSVIEEHLELISELRRPSALRFKNPEAIKNDMRGAGVA